MLFWIDRLGPVTHRSLPRLRQGEIPELNVRLLASGGWGAISASDPPPRSQPDLPAGTPGRTRTRETCRAAASVGRLERALAAVDLLDAGAYSRLLGVDCRGGATTLPTKGGESVSGTTKVEDFDRWWSVFSTTSLEKRKQHGCKGSHTFRDPNEEGRVWVLFDWDAEGWQSFVSDPEVPAILQEAGHATRPEVAEFAGQLDG